MLSNQALSNRPSFSSLCRYSALALFAGASSLALHAQQPATSADASRPAALLVADNSSAASSFTLPPTSLADLIGATYSSSSSSVDAPVDPSAGDATLAEAAGMQPPPRRRYGRPRYNDSSHNADGSNKYTFVVGAGFTAPVGNTYHYLNTSYGIEVGGGRQFNKKVAVLLQFDYDRFGFNGRTLYDQSYLYDPTGTQGLLGNIDGNSHVWSFTLDPTYNFISGDKYGAYVVVGGGFYHKTANFTTLGEGYEDYFGELIPVESQETIDKYTSNALGGNGGIGITYKASRFSGERLFIEARYTIVDNSHRSGISINNAAAYGYPYSDNYAGNNYYPANSNITTYTVYKAGIRF
jgi:hypothetical protein